MDQTEAHDILIRLDVKMTEVLSHLSKLNGRVTRLEEWEKEQRIREEAIKARGDVLLTKRQALAIVSLAIAGIPAITTFLTSVL